MAIDPAAPEREVIARPSLDTVAGPDVLVDALMHARCAGRDRASWRVIERHLRRILPRATDDDVRQDVLLAVVVHAPRLRAVEPQPVRAWLRAVCRSYVIDELRSHRVEFVSLDDANVHGPSDALCVTIDGVGNVARRLDEIVVRAARARARSDGEATMKIAQARAAIRRLVFRDSLPEVTTIVAAPLPPRQVGRARSQGRARRNRTRARVRSRGGRPLRAGC